MRQPIMFWNRTTTVMLSQIHFFLTPSLLTLDIKISFAPSALCHLIQRIWPLHLTRIPPPFLISLSQLRLSHRLWFDAHMLPDRPGPSKWWLYLNVDEREMQTAVVFVNGVLFGWGGWGVWSWLADVKQRRERETRSRDDLTTLSVAGQ